MIDILADWFSYLKNEKNYSKHTIRAYETDLHAFLRFQAQHLDEQLSLTSLEKIALKDMRAWLAHRHRDGLTPKSTARALSTVRSFFTYLDKQEILRNHAVFNVSSPKIAKSLPKALNAQDALDATNTIGQVANEDWVAKRDVALLTLIYGCGLRISEALNLNSKDLPISDVLRITGKGNKQREVPILPVVKQAIDEYVCTCPYTLDKALFIGLRGKPLRPEVFRRQLVVLRNYLGLPETATPHAFRHSFATHLLSSGGDCELSKNYWAILICHQHRYTLKPILSAY